MFLEQRLVAAGFEVELDGMGTRPVAADMQHEARGGIDLARGADRQEEAAAVEHLVDLVHAHRHFAEPHDVGAQLADGLAVRAHRGGREILVRFEDLAAIHAADLAVAAVHVDDAPGAGHLVQGIDVLGHHRHLAVVFLLETGERLVRGIGHDMAARKLLRVSL